MKENYYNSIVMIEKLHLLFLEILKYELKKLNTNDINNIQALVLYNIGENKISVGGLTSHGYYLGSNVSYNLRKMVENGYIMQTLNDYDRRSSEVKLTQKGLEMYKKMDVIFEQHSKYLNENNIDENTIINLKDTLQTIERYLNNVEIRCE